MIPSIVNPLRMVKQLPLAFILLCLISCTPSAKKDKPTDSLASPSIDTTVTSSPAEQPRPDSSAQTEEDTLTYSGPPEYPGRQQKWEYRFYGFSPDLSHVAFETTGPDDTNWVGYEFYAVNVDKNDFVGKPYRESFEGSVPDSIRNVTRAWLAKYKLPATGFIKHELNPEKEIAGIRIKGLNYTLKLLQTDIGDKRIFELQLIDSHSKMTILQKDKKLPPSRGEIKRYRLKDAYVQGNKVAVLLEMDLESYQDYENYWYYVTKYMIVTGSVGSSS